MLFEDAEIASKILEIVLTRRGSKAREENIPMCGIPHHALDNYLYRLLKEGISVAVCEQVGDSDAVKRSGKKVTERRVERLVTPGTYTDDKFLQPNQNNFLAAVAAGEGSDVFGLAWCDVSTGESFVKSCSAETLSHELQRVSPAEVLISQSMLDRHTFLRPLEKRYRVTNSIASVFQEPPTVVSRDPAPLQERRASAIITNFVKFVQQEHPYAATIRAPTRVVSSHVMNINTTSQSALELVNAPSGLPQHTVLHAINGCVTAQGSRLLRSRLLAPLMDMHEINRRLDAVEFFFNDMFFSSLVSGSLRRCGDVDRCLHRLVTGAGSPIDMYTLASSLVQCKEVMEHFKVRQVTRLPDAVSQILADMNDCGLLESGLEREVLRALAEPPKASATQPGFVADGYSAELDEIRALRRDQGSTIERLQMQYRGMCGDLGSLKIARTEGLGWCVEVPMAHSDKVTAALTEPHRVQMTTRLARFKTKELRELEQRVNESEQRILVLETEIWEDLLSRVRSVQSSLTSCARAIAVLDVTVGLATVAHSRGYCRPTVNASKDLVIHGGRHPVIENICLEDMVQYVESDCVFKEGQRLHFITGPNMGGKSTFLRQVGIICVLAQMGSFVPAQSAEVGLVDAIFTRIGMSDDISRNKSTFMVEMLDAADIMRSATERSLVIMDEIGRGTSPEEGQSIAFGVLDHLHSKIKCRSLFATHFSDLADRLTEFPNVYFSRMGILRDSEYQLLYFLRRMEPGISREAHAFDIAALAGVPQSVIEASKAFIEKEKIR